MPYGVTDLTEIINNPRYSREKMAQRIVNMPNRYGLLTSLGLFEVDDLETTYFEIEIEDMSLNLIPFSQPGAPGPAGSEDPVHRRMFPLGYWKVRDVLRADDLNGKLAPDGSGELDSMDRRLAKVLMKRNAQAWQTYEYMQWTALFGDIMDAEGRTLLNTYAAMGETKKTITWNFASATLPQLREKIDEINHHMEDEAKGQQYGELLTICGRGAWAALMANPALEKLYEQQQAIPGMKHPLINDLSATGFAHHDHVFLKHSGRASYVDQSGATVTRKFIGDNQTITVPLQADGVFTQYFGPGTAMSTVNVPGQPFFVSLKEMDHEEGIEVKTDARPMPFVSKPRLVIEGAIGS